MNISVDAVKDKKDNDKRKLVSGLIYGFLILLALIYILPLVWVVITSLKDDNVLMTSPE